MKISKRDWQKYITLLRKVSNTAADKVVKYMNSIDIDSEEGIRALLDYSYAVATKYGEGATALACQMYDEIAALSGASVPIAEPAATATYGEVAMSVRGKMMDTVNPAAIGAKVGLLVRRAGMDTMLKNGIRDGSEWAWIPSGDTCPFCLMLASNGWQKASSKVLKGNHADHIHANCDCSFVIRFDDRMDVEGYDPDALYEQYMAAEGNTSTEKINSLRRQHYAANKDLINTQKRAAYARRKTIDNGRNGSYNNSPADGELKRRYERDVKVGWISPLCGLDNYKRLFREIENKTVGKEIKGNVTIAGQTEHFMTRVAGTAVDPARVKNNVYSITGIRPQGYRSNARTGVEVEDILEALESGRVSEIRNNDGKISRQYIGNRCTVTVNPDTGILIQCNPRKR